MNKEQAINVLIQTANKAQNNGCLNLNEAVLVANAINVISTETNPTVDPDLRKDVEEIKKELNS